ncbi:hypothetical protein PR048_004180, partial [Dryococelus australis]
MQDCVTILKPLEVMTVELSGEKYSTIWKITPIVRGVQSALQKKNPTTITALSLTKNIQDSFQKRFGQNTVPVPTGEHTNVWDFFDSKINSVKETSTPTSNATISVRQYLEAPYVDRRAHP